MINLMGINETKWFFKFAKFNVMCLLAVHLLVLYTCFQIVGSKALWSLFLLLYVLPTQNKSCLVLS